MPVLPRFDLRALAADALTFARAYPAIAGRLGNPVPEPTTERMVEGAWFLAGSVIDQIEDLQLAAHERLAQRASPWLRRPLPAATVVAFDAPERVTLPATTLLTSRTSGGGGQGGDGVCSFRPVSAVVLGGYDVHEAALEARPGQPTVIRLVVESTTAAPLNEALGHGLSFYLDGDRENALEMVHLLSSQLAAASVASTHWPEPIPLPLPLIERGGLAPEESIAPDPDGPSPAFGVVTEALLFPDRFRFVAIRGLAACAEARPTSKVTLSFVVRGSTSQHAHLATRQVRTRCAAVTNLFPMTSDPLPLDLERGPLPIRVAGLPPRAASVYAVESAWATANTGEHGPLLLPDLRRMNAARRADDSPAAFATALEPATEPASYAPITTIAFSSLRPHDGVSRTVSLDLLATNSFQGAQLRSGDLRGRVDVDGQSVGYRNLVPASPYVPVPTGDAFTLRALRAAAVPAGRADPLGALRDALYLAIPSWTGPSERTRAMHLRVDSLRALDVGIARRAVGPRVTEHGYAYALTVDESAFSGAGDLGLFGAVLSEALARCAPVGTFAELTVLGARTGSRVVHRPRRRA